MSNAPFLPPISTLIQGATVLLPAEHGNGLRRVQTDVYLDAGVIVGIGAAPSDVALSSMRRVDARGLLLMPGLVDLCARFGALDIACDEASKAGITAFVDAGRGLVECRTVALRGRQSEEGRDGRCGVGVNVGDDVVIEKERAEAGASAMPFVWGPVYADADIDSLPVRALLREAMLRAQVANVPLWVQPSDPALAARGVMASGPFAVRLGLPGVPVAAETHMIETLVALMRETKAAVHLSRLSSAEGVALVRAAKAEGLPLRCDVAAHHLHLSDIDIGWFDTRFRFDPPLRGGGDRDALRQGLADGTVDAICSDHTPHCAAAKQVPFAQAPAGAPAFALLLALTVKWAAEDRVPLAEALSKISSVPRAIAFRRAGGIAVGESADLVLIDADDYWQVEDKGGGVTRAASPFAGFELPAPIRRVWVAGREISEFCDPSNYADTLQDR